MAGNGPQAPAGKDSRDAISLPLPRNYCELTAPHTSSHLTLTTALGGQSYNNKKRVLMKPFVP